MKKSKSNDDLAEDDWKTCSICGTSVKAKNFEKHLERVHIDEEIDEDYDDLPSKSNKKSGMKKSDKRKQLELEKRKRQDILMLFGMILAIGVILVGYYLYTNPSSSDVAEGNPNQVLGIQETKLAPGTNEVRIPISDVDDGKAHYYYYNDDGKRINYFVLKSSDGVIRAAFDSCDVCYEAKKGYRQEGDTMVCNNCGQRFASVKINEEKGGCNPAPLDRAMEGNNLIITKNALESGDRYF
jgi:uncharacterized membrane protein